MKLETGISALINDIVSSDQTATFLFAPSEYDKEGFLQELSGKFEYIYRFNAAVDDLRQLCVTLAGKVLCDQPAQLMRIKQILFCDSKYNGSDVVIRVALDYLKSLGKNVLLIFERLELISDVNIFEKYVYLISKAPANVRIILSSDCYLNIPVVKLEPKCPGIIDKDSLPPATGFCTPEMYLTAIPIEDVALLKYIGKYGSFPKGVLQDICPDAQERLEELCGANGGYLTKCVHTSGTEFFVLKSELVEYLAGRDRQLNHHMGDYVSVPAEQRLFDYLQQNVSSYDALLFAYRCGNTAMIDRAVQNAIASDTEIVDAMNFISAHNEIRVSAEIDKYPYAALMGTCFKAKHDRNYDEVLTEADKIIEEFKNKGQTRSIACADYLKIYCYYKKGDEESLNSLYWNLKDQFTGDDLFYFKVLQYIASASIRHGKLSVSEAEAVLNEPDGDRQFWSLKLMENIETYYFGIGNYRKSMETAERIKKLFPLYVVPLRIIAMNYFDGDLKRTKSLVDEALSYAINNSLFNDIHMLYSVKALMESFYGNEESALKYSDMAYSRLTGGDYGFERYFTVYVRCYLNCIFNRVAYAEKLANLYLHESEAMAPKYRSMMYQIYSYAALKDGNRARSYKAATLAIDAAENRSFVWLYSMGLAANCLLAKGGIRDVDSIVTNILRCSENYGMRMVLTDTAVFGPILSEAESHNIEPDIVSKIKALIDSKNGAGGDQGILNVTMLGAGVTSITSHGKEIQWKTRKSKELFLHYILAGENGIDRNVIIDYMWKDYVYDSAINNLKTTNNIIRKTLTQYGIKFKLEYINSTYVLHLEDLNCDYHRFLKLSRDFSETESLTEKVRIMRNILRLYKGDLCTELDYADFNNARNAVRHELIFGLINVIRLLARENHKTDAKEFWSVLKNIDNTSAYESLATEILQNEDNDL